MVAIIKTGHSIHSIFNYNENKVKQGVAECIGEGNYPMDVDKMSDTMKLNRFLKQAALNDNVKRNSVHISLNFDPSENYSNGKLMAIANSYMEKIGFREQPYLVYQHYDSAHPHIHITSIKVRADGSRIDMHNIGRNQSETARKEIEKSFGLVVAEGRRKNHNKELQPISIGKVKYGRIQSKKAISNVLSQVLTSYRYASLAELNAVLKQYNVLADRGNENSRIFKAKGLVYRILDDDGKSIGVPIKASDFYYTPTLKFLEKKFISNATTKTSDKSRIKNVIDKAFLRTKMSMTELVVLLEKEGINTVFRKNAEGLLYGITYVDHTTKCVFNGSALGKEYSAKAIQDRCTSIRLVEQKTTDSNTEKSQNITFETPNSEIMATLFGSDFQNNKYVGSNTLMRQLAAILTESQQTANYIPNQLKGKKKKKKRRGQSDNQ
ncbi:relaxase/mobilization nuclease domain-containing protein [Flavobacterium sp. PL02]|uniref:relaxase/mobilization nuclease domain-containing protein n=1 Tax=Flavobacterium sp. PL02 TaxID=3088354 RepID=UPI002B229E66|nr:relaxase/mobilization nuclease domain-containing protein [Flavobacterium sp. PL02]MEA9414311.1 relaxase/mobilization nuclease domain-containing protein [Flavobacterium sp. PL02]